MISRVVTTVAGKQVAMIGLTREEIDRLLDDPDLSARFSVPAECEDVVVFIRETNEELDARFLELITPNQEKIN